MIKQGPALAIQACKHAAPSQRDLLKLSHFGALKRLKPKNLLWQQGQPASTMALILSGELVSLRGNELGHGMLVLGRHGKGAVLGAIELLGGRPHPTTVRAHTPTSLLLLSHSDLVRLADQEPELARRLQYQLWHATAHQIDHLIGRLTIFN